MAKIDILSIHGLGEGYTPPQPPITIGRESRRRLNTPIRPETIRRCEELAPGKTHVILLDDPDFHYFNELRSELCFAHGTFISVFDPETGSITVKRLR